MPDGPSHPETWIFHLAMAWLGDPDHSLTYQERLAMIKERAKEMGEPARSAFTWIPDDTLVHRADISYWVTQPWDNHGGRMTLVGDAAHPMPPCDLNTNPPGTKSVILGGGRGLVELIVFFLNRSRPRSQPLHLRLVAPPRRPAVYRGQQINFCGGHYRIR